MGLLLDVPNLKFSPMLWELTWVFGMPVLVKERQGRPGDALGHLCLALGHPWEGELGLGHREVSINLVLTFTSYNCCLSKYRTVPGQAALWAGGLHGLRQP